MSEKESERVVNTAARGRTGVREINLQLSKLVLEHRPKTKYKKKNVLILAPGKEITGCVMTFLIPHVFLFLICSAGFFSVSFLGVSSGYTGRQCLCL